MFGETVLVREFGGRPVVCKVWEVTREKVYICTQENFERLKANKDKSFPSNCFPIGFPKQDVFRYNPKRKIALNDWRNNPKFWEQMTRYA